MAIEFEQTGSFKDTESFLNRMSKDKIADSLAKYGAVGVAMLEYATPVDTGMTAGSWYSEIKKENGVWTLSWHSQNETSSGIPVVILLQYGHGTGTGGYVSGRDFINPAIQPVFDLIVSEIRREVSP